MSYLELFLIGIGLSMDAFAVSICRGLAMKKLRWRDTLVIGLFFGGFQALMPLAGWLLGSRLSVYIENVDHWIAFILLALIGGNMVREALGEDEGTESCEERLDYRELFLMAVATSIDALAVGVTFAFLSVSIVPAITIIGVTTFCLSVAGVVVGNFFGSRWRKQAEITGGVILILLGLKILLEHLGLL
jgi:Predicted membrane protein